MRIAQAGLTRLWLGDELIEVEPAIEQSDGYIAHCYTTRLDASRPLRIEKIVAMYTSRDRAISDPGLDARETIEMVTDFDALLKRHTTTWKHLWHRFDFDIEHSDSDQEEQAEKILRLHVIAHCGKCTRRRYLPTLILA